MDNKSQVKILESKTNQKWSNISDALIKSEDVKNKLSELLNDDLTKLYSNDCELILFGSLARKEFTQASDLDWTLLVDGQVIPEHQETAIKIRRKIEENNYNKPGTTGTFGGLAFSHDIVHYIGGSDDSNKNMTRRILLLLESVPIQTNNDSIIYERVIKNVLKRYLSIDSAYRKNQFPRFLVNDMVRYWRTICVDFAAKEWQQTDSKWVLRNIKLRFSRKLLFVVGMLMCLSLYKKNFKDIDTSEELMKYVKNTPLELLASFINSNETLIEIGGNLFTSYDFFLGVLNDKNQRENLEKLKPENIEHDELFLKLREESHKFQKGLTELFFEKETLLKGFNKEYGVF